jgi:hypothetical protein
VLSNCRQPFVKRGSRPENVGGDGSWPDWEIKMAGELTPSVRVRIAARFLMRCLLHYQEAHCASIFICMMSKPPDVGCYEKEKWPAWAYLTTDRLQTPSTLSELTLSATVNRTHVHASQCTLVLFWNLSNSFLTDFLHLLASRGYLSASSVTNLHRLLKM